MRVGKLRSVLAALAFLAIAAAPPAAQDVAGAHSFVARVYAHYPIASDDPHPFELFGKNEREVFDASLAGLIEEDTRLAGGEVGALDGDPLCDCQDDSGDSYTVGVARPDGPNGAVVEVVRHDHNVKPVALETIRISLRHIGGVWRIHDVGSPDMPSLRAYLTKANKERSR